MRQANREQRARRVTVLCGLWSFIVLLMLHGHVFAERLSLEGQLIQGGLVQGHTDPDAIVKVNGEPVRLSPDGIFLVGFDRDSPPEVELEVVRGDGKNEKRVLHVERRKYQIQRVDGLPERKVTPKKEDLERIREEARLAREARQRDDPRTDFIKGFGWPAKGRITGVYGSQRILNGKPRTPHYGLDIAGPIGTPVVAPADGVVTLVHPDMFFSGTTLIVDHGHGLSSTFIHLNKILVKEGERVRRGEPIAEIGASGRATGPHLDWRMNWFQNRIDPQLLVSPMPAE